MACRMTRLLCLSLLFLVLGCDDHEVTFKCVPGGPACPKDEVCPEIPLGSGGCETLPGLFGHDEEPVDVGRPVGCTVGLSYGNPNYGGDQQTCTCEDRTGSPAWICPL